MSTNEFPRPYHTVVIPWSDTPTQWHPTDKEGSFSTLTRGNFATESEANTWARIALGGQPYTIKYVDPLKDELAFINEHREATGHEPFTTLTEEEVISHLKRIEKMAPYGQDPWTGDLVCVPS
mgnify:FL=1